MVSGNLLVTYDHNAKGHAEQEVRARLEDVEAHVVSVEETNFEGLFEVLVKEDAREVVFNLKFLCKESPELFLHTHHWVPIDLWVPPYIDEMAKVTAEWGALIGKDERWMLHLHKRHTGKHSSDLIEKLTEPVHRGKVDLVNPERIIVVEILGERAGMSLVQASELLDVGKLREDMEKENI